MKTILSRFVFAVLMCRLAAAGAEVTIGMDEAALMDAKGAPQATLTTGGKTIYRWPDMVVNLENAKVVSINRRDLQREQAEQRRRAALAAEVKRKAEIALQEAEEAAKKQAAEAERLRPQREVAELKAKMEKLEKQKAEEAATLQRQIDDLEGVRQTQIQDLRQAIDTSGYYYRKARDEGDKGKAATLLRVLLNQQAQLSALTGEPIH